MFHSHAVVIVVVGVLLFTFNVGGTPQLTGKYSAKQNFKPRFSKKYNPLILEVNENTKPGFKLSDVSEFASDDEHDTLRYNLDDSGVGSEVCTIGREDGILKLKISPDREVKNEYRFKVFVSDNFEGGINREASLDVRLRIKDENDNKPVFQNTPYDVDVPENVDVGSDVLTISATDQDDFRNKYIRYFFKESTDHKHFHLDVNSGVISIAEGLDYENKSRYVLHVVARDEGSPALSEETRVVVNVIDIGDNPPYFVLHTYEEDIKENLQKGTSIAFVKAKDADKGIDNEINYAIIAGDEYGLFRINQKTGHVTVQADLDREYYTEFKLRIKAYEVPQPESYATIDFKITLLDENDNKPKFEKKEYKILVSEDKLNVDTILNVTIKATDDDATWMNNVITYGIDENKYFKIMPKSGTLALRKSLTKRLTNTFSFFVYATEKSTTEHYTAKVNVTVQIVPTPSAPAISGEKHKSSATYTHTGNTWIIWLVCLFVLPYL